MMQENLEKINTRILLNNDFPCALAWRLCSKCSLQTSIQAAAKWRQDSCSGSSIRTQKTCGTKKRLCAWRRTIWGESKTSLQFETALSFEMWAWNAETRSQFRTRRTTRYFKRFSRHVHVNKLWRKTHILVRRSANSSEDLGQKTADV